MKIAIIGTHSTGKTTLIKHLKTSFEARGKEVIVLEELARLCPMPINEQTTLDAQKWILLNQIARETEIQHGDKIFLTDRSALDNFAYMYRITTHQDVSHFEKAAVEHMATYDFIFKTQKLDLQAKADGIRTTDKEFRDMIDRMIDHVFTKNQVNYDLLPKTMDYQTHVDCILACIDSETPR